MTSADRPRVLVAAPLPGDLRAALRDAFDLQEMPPAMANDEAAVAAALANADGLLLSEAVRVTAELLDRCPRLRVISKVGVGYDRIDVDAATARNILVCNTPGVLNGAVADLTFALLLALTRRLRANEERVRTGAWKASPELLGHDIRGGTLGIIGFGGIGRTVARTARGFEMNVVYYRRTRDHDAEASGLATFCERDVVFREADVVSVHCPLTSGTRRSIGAREFSLMKRSSYFVNTSRGAVVDQPALVRALESGMIAGAALDVMDPEPLDPADPLCALPNVVLTPHIGSGTVETRRTMHELAVRNLLQGMAGDVPAAAVNPQVAQAR
jgi:lactate dehydrogenase-like 2-hydroxyacid dehydrogenase